MGNKATIICVMDTSGSMGHTKKTLAKKYFHMFKGIIDGRYDEVDCKFISHTTVAKEVDGITELISRGESGGTYLSSGANLALNLINRNVNPFNEDVFTVFFSDGDNWGEDNDNFVESVNKLCEKCINVQFVEVKVSTYVSTILNKLTNEIASDNFTSHRIFNKDNIKDITSEMFSKDFSMNAFSIIREKDEGRLSKNIAKIDRKGKTTIVELADGAIGSATCNTGDKYDEELGFKLAKTRAEIKSKENELNKLLNVK